jgi:polysaccharide biosynthesis protein PslG
LAIELLLLLIAPVATTLLVLFVRGGPRSPAPPMPMPSRNCPRPAIGVYSTLAFEGEAQQQREVEAIHKTLDAQVARVNLRWDGVEPVEGKFDWSVTDSAVKDLRAAGIQPLLVINGSPPWANRVPLSRNRQRLRVPPRGPAFDAWLDRYSDFVDAAVRRYDGLVARWEIWNEPNLATFWLPRPDPIAYRHLYERLRATILSVEPNAQVAVGGLGSLTVGSRPNIPGRVFLGRFMRAHPPVDYVAVHSYTTDDHPPNVDVPGENNFSDIERIHRQLKAAGYRAPIWVTEWGWSSAKVGENRQARYVGESLWMLEHRYRFVHVATYFLDHDLRPTLRSGLLNANLMPKPAARVFRANAQRLAARCE